MRVCGGPDATNGIVPGINVYVCDVVHGHIVATSPIGATAAAGAAKMLSDYWWPSPATGRSAGPAGRLRMRAAQFYVHVFMRSAQDMDIVNKKAAIALVQCVCKLTHVMCTKIHIKWLVNNASARQDAHSRSHFGAGVSAQKTKVQYHCLCATYYFPFRPQQKRPRIIANHPQCK